MVCTNLCAASEIILTACSVKFQTTESICELCLSYRFDALAKQSQEECVKILISVGADVNKVDNEGYSALMIAAGMGDTNVIEQLIKAGANVNASSQHGHTALNLMIGI